MNSLKKSKVSSVNNVECIGPCVPPGISYFHPIIQLVVHNDKYPTCPTQPYINERGVLVYVDICDDKYCEDFNLSDMTLKSVVPSLSMDPKTFLQLIYGITSFEDTINWIYNNDDIVLTTLDRILNCTWTIYINEIPNIKLMFIDFYKMFINKYWLRYILRKTNKKDLKSVMNNSDLIDKIIYNSFRKILYEHNNELDIPYNRKMRKYIIHYIIKYT